MEGTVNISDFIAHLRDNDLVIVPQRLVAKDYATMQKKLLRKNMATYKEIADSGIWGQISKTRVYQIAHLRCRDNEIVMFGAQGNAAKIVSPAIKRIAVERGTINFEL